MMATTLAASLLTSRGDPGASSQPAHEGAGPARAPSDLPLIVHLVLDEHIGLEGLPDDLTPRSFKEETRSFFVDRKFRLFGAAHSEYPWTEQSLSHLLNLTSGKYVSDLLTQPTKRRTYRLTRNAYFQRLEQQGYAVRVHQTGFLDVCAGRIPPSACHCTATPRYGFSIHCLSPRAKNCRSLLASSSSSQRLSSGSRACTPAAGCGCVAPTFTSLPGTGIGTSFLR